MSHGGKRINAGRKKLADIDKSHSSVVRINSSYISLIKDILSELKSDPNFYHALLRIVRNKEDFFKKDAEINRLNKELEIARSDDFNDLD